MKGILSDGVNEPDMSPPPIIAQIPASGPKLKSAITAAAEYLEQYRYEHGFSWGSSDTNALLWRTLLNLSSQGSDRIVTPLFKRQELAIPSRVELTGRRWAQWQRWYAREIQHGLEHFCSSINVPVLYGARLSDGRGGYADSSEAFYYLSFCSPLQCSAREPVDSVDREQPNGFQRVSCSWWLCAGIGASAALTATLLIGGRARRPAPR